MDKLNNGSKILYYGHSTFQINSVSGKRIIIDPWIMGNPACPETLKEIEGVDIIAVTHGHSGPHR